MASSSQDIQETSSPSETTPPSRRLPRKPRRPATPPSLARIISPLPSPPPPLKPSATRTFTSVPAEWCPQNKTASFFPYYATDPLLKNMFQRRFHLRPMSYSTEGIIYNQEMKNVGPPTDFWMTFPLRLPTRALESIQESPFFITDLSPDDELTHVQIIGPVNATLDTLNWPPGTGPYPALVRPFSWVTVTETDTSGTKLLTLEEISLLPWGVRDYAKCDNCESIMTVKYLLPRRFEAIKDFLSGKKGEILEDGENILKKLKFPCRCNHKTNNGTPVNINKDFRRINWLFLFLGCALGYCSLDQLEFYCKERKLSPTGDTKNHLLLAVVLDIRKQLDPQSSEDEL